MDVHATQPDRRLTVIQAVPALDGGGVEFCTLDTSAALIARGHRSIVISAGGRLVERLLAQGGEHITVPFNKKSPLSLLQAVALRRIIVNNQADIIQARSRLPAWIAFLACKSLPAILRPRFLTTVHGLNSVNRYSKVMTYGEQIVAVSECCREYVLRNYPATDPGKLIVIPHGVDPQQYPYGYRPSAPWLTQWHREFPQLINRFVILLAGRLTRLKGHFDFLAVIEKLIKTGVPTHGLIVGGEDPRRRQYAASIRAEISHRGLSQHITLAGHRSDLREIMSSADAVVSTSTKPESFGLTVLESLKLGRPSFGYNHGGVSEILAAIYPVGRIPVGNTTALAEKLCELHAGIIPPPTESSLFDKQTALDRELRLYESLAG
jgi:glycosyltransferase involved in cell wall biosynthesis